MSGFPCSSCDRNVPDYLEPCPHCGHFTPPPQTQEPLSKSEQADNVKAALALLAEAREIARSHKETK